MGAVLRRAASSPNIKERADCSAALFTAAGELLVQAEHIPVHLGSMPASVRGRDRRCSAARSARRRRDEVILNDPFAGGTHLNDVTLVAPVFVDGVLVGWVANRAHHADVGGTAPGSMPPDATDDRRGRHPSPADAAHRRSRWTRFVAASRTPGRAERRPRRAAWRQRARCAAVPRGGRVRGARRATAAVARRAARLRRAPDARRARALPDGEWHVEDVLDSAGPASGAAIAGAASCSTLRVRGDEVTFDFTGTDAQRPGNMHAVEAVTVSAVEFAVRAATDPTIPANGGAMRPVHVLAPRGTVVVGAVAPVAVGGRQRRGEPAGRRRVPRTRSRVARPDALGAAARAR